MCGECNVFNVTPALESYMITGVRSCGSVRPPRRIVALINIPPKITVSLSTCTNQPLSFAILAVAAVFHFPLDLPSSTGCRSREELFRTNLLFHVSDHHIFKSGVLSR